MNIFELATKSGLRYPSVKGFLTTEDLWNLPLTSKASGLSLNNVAKEISRQMREEMEENFVSPTPASTDNTLRLDIVKHIIAVKMEEQNAANAAVARKQKEAKILAILAEKQDQSLASKSEEELREMLENL